ncbi:hypothetical protein ACFXGI_10765 [Streptomyces sp. NPDC059355]
MAGRGPAPKDPARRRRRNAADPETVITPDARECTTGVVDAIGIDWSA